MCDWRENVDCTRKDTQITSDSTETTIEETTTTITTMLIITNSFENSTNFINNNSTLIIPFNTTINVANSSTLNTTLNNDNIDYEKFEFGLIIISVFFVVIFTNSFLFLGNRLPFFFKLLSYYLILSSIFEEFQRAKLFLIFNIQTRNFS